MTPTTDSRLTIGVLIGSALLFLVAAIGITISVSASLWWLIPCAVLLACWLGRSALQEHREHRQRQERDRWRGPQCPRRAA